MEWMFGFRSISLTVIVIICLQTAKEIDLPTVVGAVAPQENLNSDRNFGIDLELSHQNKIGDLLYKVKAIGTITRKMFLPQCKTALMETHTINGEMTI
jgi:hypothetical protein